MKLRFVLALLAASAAWQAKLHAAPCDAPQPIHFAPGTSAAVAKGGIARGELACLTIWVRAGQAMSVRLGSAENNAVTQIYLPGWKIARDENGFEISGPTLPGTAEGSDARAWAGRVPRSGTYLLALGTTRGGADYTLRIAVR